MKEEALKYMKDNSSDNTIQMFNTKKCTWIYLVEYLMRFGEQLKQSDFISDVSVPFVADDMIGFAEHCRLTGKHCTYEELDKWSNK